MRSGRACAAPLAPCQASDDSQAFQKCGERDDGYWIFGLERSSNSPKYDSSSCGVGVATAPQLAPEKLMFM